jgi:CubicO group peptidase (beta-lactamase class C family)
MFEVRGIRVGACRSRPRLLQSFTASVRSVITRSGRFLAESTHRLTESAPNLPLHAFDHQDEIFSSAFSIVGQAIEERAFPAASLAVTHKGKLVALKTLGRFTFPKDSSMELNAELTFSTLFDLASLTKAIATTTMAMILYERGLLELETPVVGIVSEFIADNGGGPDPRRRDVTFRMLLSHSSGLPAYEKLFLKARSSDDLLRAAFATPLSTDPGTRAEYSDLGFMILGAALERIAGDSLDRFCQREIFGPLAMTHTTFNPPAKIRMKIPPTADERAGSLRSTFRQRVIQGEVQDENACVLGGVAGHAGLFSTAEDIAVFAHSMLRGSRILRPQTVALFTHRESAPSGTCRTLGWDTPSAPSQSGKYFGSASYGHLGYTGTSLWIDPDRDVSITLLTNRTWPDCSNDAIKEVRPRVYDALIEAIVEVL